MFPGGDILYFCIFFTKVLKSNAAYERANGALSFNLTVLKNAV